MSIRNYISKNIVLIVMVPFLFGAHYGWLKLQKIDTLVPPEDRGNLPPIFK